MSSVIVTGANGFVGKHLIEELKTTVHQIIEVSRASGEIADKSTWNKLPKADVVIHLAARPIISESWSDVTGFMESNLMGTVEALNYCKVHGARLIYISSYLYGNSGSLPVTETAEISVNNPYSFTKMLAEETCSFYSQYFDVPVIILRPFNVYGSGQSENFIIPVLIAQAVTNKSFYVKDLTMRRDYLYVKDFVRAIVAAIDYNEQYEIFNLGSGKSYSGKDLVDIIQTCAGTQLPVFSDPTTRNDEIMDTIANISKAKKLLLWEPRWSLSEGIRDMMSDIPKVEVMS